MNLIEQFKADKEEAISDGIGFLGMFIVLIASEMILHPLHNDMLSNNADFGFTITLVWTNGLVITLTLLHSLYERYTKLSQGV